MKRVVLILALVVLAVPLVATAQGQAGRIAGVVTDDSGAVLPGATVTIKGEGAAAKTTTSDATGKYLFENVAPGVYEVTIELSGFTKQVLKVTVTPGQTANTETKLPIGGQVETVQVTGTLIPRPTLEAMSPVTTLDVEELTYRGMNRVEDLLQSMPQVFAAQNSTVSNGSSGTATVDLRYLGSVRTLVLMDGRRMPPGDSFQTAPDLNFVPSAMVKRVDVLTGGASSVYGADAVAGVVNFVLDRQFQGFRGGFQQSDYQHNNRNDLAQSINKAKEFSFPSGNVWNSAPTDFNLGLGGLFGDRKGHAAVYLDYRTTPGITKDQRDYTNCSVLGGMTMSGPTCSGSSTWQGGRFQVFPADPDDPNSKTYVIDPTTGQMRARTSADVYNYAPANYMQRPDTRWAGGAFLNYSWNTKANAYGEVMFMDDKTDAQIAPSGDFNNTSLLNCNNPMLTADMRDKLCTQMGYGPTDLATVYIGRRNIEGGGRVDRISHQALRFSFGLKGDLSKAFSYDIYGLQGQVRAPHEYANDLNAARLQQALLVTGDPANPSTWQCTDPSNGCVPWNIFRQGGVTKAALNFLQLPEVMDSGTRTRLIDGRISGDLKPYGIKFGTATEALKFAAGYQWRDEWLYVRPDLAYQLALGAGSGGPTLPVDGTYHANELYVEGLFPIVQDATMAKDLSLEVGYRSSEYSTVGRWPTYKFQGSWAPASSLKLRAGFNRATRSPNINELFTPQGLGLGGSLDNCAGTRPQASQAQCALQGVPAAAYGTIAENPANQYNTLGGGNPVLQPEIANTWTAGLVVAPAKFAGFTAALDYFRIKIDDTIGSLGADDILRQCAATGSPVLCGLIHRDRAYTLWLTTDAFITTTNQNVGKHNVEGLDVNATYSKALGGAGMFSVNIIGSYLRKQFIDTGLYAYDCVGYFGNTCGVPNPSWRHLARFSWETKWNAVFSVGWRYTGHVTIDEASPNPALFAGEEQLALDKANNIFEIPAFHYIDLGATWKIAKSYKLVAGINNLFDKEPPLAPGQSPNDYGTGFYGMYDPLGRYMHWGLQFTF